MNWYRLAVDRFNASVPSFWDVVERMRGVKVCIYPKPPASQFTCRCGVNCAGDDTHHVCLNSGCAAYLEVIENDDSP